LRRCHHCRISGAHPECLGVPRDVPFSDVWICDYCLDMMDSDSDEDDHFDDSEIIRRDVDDLHNMEEMIFTIR
jgi:hypothetical protein